MSHKHSNLNVIAVFVNMKCMEASAPVALAERERKAQWGNFILHPFCNSSSNFHQGERAPLFLALASSWGWKDRGPGV